MDDLRRMVHLLRSCTGFSDSEEQVYAIDDASFFQGTTLATLEELRSKGLLDFDIKNRIVGIQVPGQPPVRDAIDTYLKDMEEVEQSIEKMVLDMESRVKGSLKYNANECCTRALAWLQENGGPSKRGLAKLSSQRFLHRDGRQMVSFQFKVRKWMANGPRGDVRWIEVASAPSAKGTLYYTTCVQRVSVREQSVNDKAAVITFHSHLLERLQQRLFKESLARHALVFKFVDLLEEQVRRIVYLGDSPPGFGKQGIVVPIDGGVLVGFRLSSHRPLDEREPLTRNLHIIHLATFISTEMLQPAQLEIVKQPGEPFAINNWVTLVGNHDPVKT